MTVVPSAALREPHLHILHVSALLRLYLGSVRDVAWVSAASISVHLTTGRISGIGVFFSQTTIRSHP